MYNLYTKQITQKLATQKLTTPKLVTPKRWLLLALLPLLLMLIVTGCSPAPAEQATSNVPDASEGTSLELTLEELKAYNGKNGQPAYVAYEGTIYDVSQIPQWADGEHNGVSAGVDITKLIERSPHGPKNIKLATPVGKIVE